MAPPGESGTLSADALYKPFPAHEIQVASGATVTPLMMAPPVIGFDPADLLLPPNRSYKDIVYFGPSLIGKYLSQDPQHRFSLAITQSQVTVTESKAGGATLIRSSGLRPKDGYVAFTRSNDDAVLSFLDFKPSSRQWMIGQGVQPSYMLLFFENGLLKGEWHGATLTLNPNGTPNQLIQPLQSAGKVFVFAPTN
jgi:hypothetical protein